MGEVLFLLTGDTSCYIQVIRSYLYALAIIQHGKLIFLIILNGDSLLVRDLEYRLVPGHGVVAFCIIKSLKIHENILRNQDSALEFRHEDNIVLQD